MKAVYLNTRWRPHFILGAIIGLWLVLLLVFLGPFDAAEVPFRIRAIILPPYGLLFLVAYLTAVGLQNLIYRRWQRWSWPLEIAVVLFSYFLGVFLCFAYYKTDIIRGTYSFPEFVGSIYLPIVLLLNFLVLAGRWFISRKPASSDTTANEQITLSGDGRKDLLQLSPDQLVYAVSAQNYVEIHYLVGGMLKKHLLRTTLKKVEEQTPTLHRIHRSHLINPTHFRRWTGPNSLEIYAVEVPVSKQYRTELEKLLS